MTSASNVVKLVTLVCLLFVFIAFGHTEENISRVGRLNYSKSTQSSDAFPAGKKTAHDFHALNTINGTDLDSHHYKWKNDKSKHKGRTKTKKRKKKSRRLTVMTHDPNATFQNDLSNINSRRHMGNETEIRRGRKFRKRKKHKQKEKRHKTKTLSPKSEGELAVSDGPLLRGKRLSLHPRFFGHPHRRGGARSLIGHHDWMRSLHRHHEQVASSMRNQINSHLQRTKQQWLNALGPHTEFLHSIPTFPEISEQILSGFPSIHSFIPPVKRKKNSIPKEIDKDTKYFGHPYHKEFGHGKWDGIITTSTPVRNTPRTTKEQKQFKVTRSRPQANEITPYVPTTEGNKINIDENNSIWPRTDKELVPKTSKRFPVTESPNSSGRFPTFDPDFEEEYEDRWKNKFIPYGNDITKGISKDILNKGKDIDSEWEWIPMLKGKNDVSYGRENREGGINKRENDDRGHHDEAEEDKDVKTTFEIDHCLKCPAKRTVHAPRGQDYVPLFIPTPQDTCHHSGVLRYHVEVGPGYPLPGSLLGEGHYYINVSILGNKGKIPLKTCTYDYEVQVYKCPVLPHVTGSQVECSAGEAWGSKCFWKCDKGKKLVGSLVTTCGGSKKTPAWLSDPPICEEVGCPIPKGLDGTSLSCSLPIPHESIQDKLETMTVYPKGSKCQIRCKTGFTLDNEYAETVTVSKCLANGKWLPDIQTCCKKKKILPEPFHGDCNDINVQINGVGSVQIVPPKFFTSVGKPAHVWCDIDSVRQEGRHCRTCKAHDKSRGLTASCRQCINVSSRLGCPSIQAPKNGNLECRNTAEGDILCKITCKNGFFLPPYISSGSVRCPRGMSLWDFQSFREERLPSCILR